MKMEGNLFKFFLTFHYEVDAQKFNIFKQLFEIIFMLLLRLMQSFELPRMLNESCISSQQEMNITLQSRMLQSMRKSYLKCKNGNSKKEDGDNDNNIKLWLEHGTQEICLD